MFTPRETLQGIVIRFPGSAGKPLFQLNKEISLFHQELLEYIKTKRTHLNILTPNISGTNIVVD